MIIFFFRRKFSLFFVKIIFLNKPSKFLNLNSGLEMVKPTHFSKNPKNVSLSGQNENVDYKFNDHKDVADKTGF